MRSSHKEEVQKIQESYDKQIEDVIQAEKKMTETIRAVEEEYKQRNQNLDRKKRKEIESVIKENAEDPDLITKRISEITGFEIYVK
jgi:phage-related tail protein